jgi:hypothetical protein
MWSCKPSIHNSTPPLVQDYKVIPVDKLLVAFDTTKMQSELEDFYQTYPAFSKLYFEQILPIKQSNAKDELANELRKFLRDPDIKWLYDTSHLILPDLSKIKPSLDDAFAWYQYYFPNREVPDIYTFISAFQYQRFLFEDENQKDAIGLGLEFFLGSEFPYHQMVPNNPNFSKFLSWTFDQKFIPKKISEVLIDDLMGDARGNRLLDYMIHNGKKWYILSQILPNEKMPIIAELTEEQWSWCLENELEIWSFFLNEKLFYESNYMKINKLILPSPVAPPGMPSNAPGQTGNYMGWRIIQTFMNKYPETSLIELLNIQDAQVLLDKSKFKPRKK